MKKPVKAPSKSTKEAPKVKAVDVKAVSRMGATPGGPLPLFKPKPKSGKK